MTLLAIALLLILGFQGADETSRSETNANRWLEVSLLTSPQNLQASIDPASELAFLIQFFQRDYLPLVNDKDEYRRELS